VQADRLMSPNSVSHHVVVFCLSRESTASYLRVRGSCTLSAYGSLTNNIQAYHHGYTTFFQTTILYKAETVSTNYTAIQHLNTMKSKTEERERRAR